MSRDLSSQVTKEDMSVHSPKGRHMTRGGSFPIHSERVRSTTSYKQVTFVVVIVKQFVSQMQPNLHRCWWIERRNDNSLSSTATGFAPVEYPYHYTDHNFKNSCHFIAETGVTSSIHFQPGFKLYFDEIQKSAEVFLSFIRNWLLFASE